MINVRCPQCNSGLGCPDSQVGKKVSCPRCNSSFRVSSPDPFSDLEEPRPVPKEPWYYGYVEKYTTVLHWLSIALYGGAAIAATIGFILMGLMVTAAAKNPLWAVPLILPWLVWIVVCVLGLLLHMVGIAVLHMAVDTCRNIRATRYGI